MRSIGFPVFAYKLGAFVLAGALAGLAGYLAACQFGFVNPEILAWHQSGTVLMMVILGGMGRLHGAVLGAFAYVLVAGNIFCPGALGAYAKHWQLAMGSLIVLIVLALPHGIGGLYRLSYARSAQTKSAMSAGTSMIEPILQVRRLTKNFGGLAAVDNVSLEVDVGELHAVIGPNGAGKTTLINMLSGDLSPSAGSDSFPWQRNRRDLAPEQRSRLGIGRSYQKTNIFPGFSALENCRLAAQSREPHPCAIGCAMHCPTIGSVESARQALAAVGLSERARL